MPVTMNTIKKQEIYRKTSLISDFLRCASNVKSVFELTPIERRHSCFPQLHARI